MQKGRIIKSLSGFYYVSNENGTFRCKGRGVFRKRKISPLVGEFVKFELDENDERYINEIESITNELIRPPIANVDQAVILSSVKNPEFNPKLLDRFLVLIESAGIKPIIFVTKMDLVNEEELNIIQKIKNDYEDIGYDFQLLSIKQSNEQHKLLDYFPNQI